MWFASNNRKYSLNIGPKSFNEDRRGSQMKGEDKGEDLWIFTAETNNRTAVFIYLFIHLFIQQRVGNRYIGEVAGEYFSFFFFFLSV